MKALSLCIPRLMDNSITKNDIFKIFNRYNWGPISRIDIVRKNGNARAFVHYNYWFTNDQTKTIKQKLQQGGEAINIMYAQPWFWKCSMSKIPKS